MSNKTWGSDSNKDGKIERTWVLIRPWGWGGLPQEVILNQAMNDKKFFEIPGKRNNYYAL